MKFFTVLLSFFCLVSCAQVPSQPVSFFQKPVFSRDDKSDVVSARAILPPVVHGSESSLASDKTYKAVSSFGSSVSLDTAEKPVEVSCSFDNASIEDVLNVVLVDLFGASYSMAPDSKHKISLHISGKYTLSQFLPLLSAALHSSGLDVVISSGRLCQIVPFKSASAAGGVSASAGVVSRLIRLRYLSAAAALDSVKPFLSQDAVSSFDKASNSILVTDSAVNIQKVLSLVALTDVPFFSDIEWRIFPLRHVSSDIVAGDINKLFATGGIYAREGIVAGSFQVLSINSANAVLVLTRWRPLLSLVSSWLQTMDIIGASGSYYVYFVRHSTAVHLAGILSRLVSQGVSASASQSEIPAAMPSLSSSGALNSTGASGSTAVSGANTVDVSSSSLNTARFGDVVVVPDASTNSLLFRCNSGAWDDLSRLLSSIDIVRKQVMVNVAIIEITLSNSSSSGYEFLFNTSFLGSNFQLTNDTTAGVQRGNDTPLGSVNGFTFGVFDSQKVLNSLLYASKSKSSMNLLSSPDVLVLDGSTATIEVGDDVPTQTGSTTSATSGSTVTNTVAFKKVGVLLKVTPSIGDGGSVTLDLNQEVSEIGDFVASLNNYKFLTRKIDTSLLVPDGHTVVIGGLMRVNDSHTKSSIPVLSDIPYVGRLFTFKGTSKTKTELVVMITPSICASSASLSSSSEKTYERFPEISK